MVGFAELPDPRLTPRAAKHKTKNPPEPRQPGGAWAKGGSRAPSPRSCVSSHVCVCVKSQSDRFELKTRESVCVSVCVCVGVFKHQKVCVHVFPVNVCVDRANPPSATGWAARHTTTIHTNIFVTVGVQKARRAAAQQKASAPAALQSAQQTHAFKAPV